MSKVMSVRLYIWSIETKISAWFIGGIINQGLVKMFWKFVQKSSHKSRTIVKPIFNSIESCCSKKRKTVSKNISRCESKFEVNSLKSNASQKDVKFTLVPTILYLFETPETLLTSIFKFSWCQFINIRCDEFLVFRSKMKKVKFSDEEIYRKKVLISVFTWRWLARVLQKNIINICI